MDGNKGKDLFTLGVIRERLYKVKKELPNFKEKKVEAFSVKVSPVIRSHCNTINFSVCTVGNMYLLHMNNSTIMVKR